MSDSPFFSIIVPAYNRAKLLNTTLDNIFKQSFTDFEVIVVNDGSTDNTIDILENRKEEKLNYYTTENQERGAARNFGVSKSSGQYITFLDSDDEIFPNHLAEADLFIKRNQTSVFFQQHAIKIGDSYNANYQPKKTVNKELIKTGNFMSCLGVFLKRKIAVQFPFVENRKLSGSEDFELWLRIAATHEILFNNVVTAALVHHAERSVLAVEKKALVERKLLMLEYLLKDPNSQEYYSKAITDLKANAYSYISLHLAMARQKLAAIKYLFLTLTTKMNYLGRRRTWSTIKHLFFS